MNNKRTFPFGNPDGARYSVFDDALEGFIDINSTYFSGVDSNNIEEFLKIRCITGPKGSGKTLYLRKIKASLHSEESIYSNFDEVYSEMVTTLSLPSTEQIISFSQCFSQDNVTEKWQRLWKSAIIISVISHILSTEILSKKLTSDDNHRLLEYIKEIRPDIVKKSRQGQTIVEAVNVYAAVNAILNRYKTVKTINNYLNNPVWDSAIEFISKKANILPPFYLFIDCIDEDYAHAPFYWMRCQKGLFYECMRFLKDDALGGRLHIIIAIRDQVFLSISKSEHISRYMQDSFILQLRWDFAAAEYFLKSKVETLDDECFYNKGEKTVENWIGISEIENKIRGISESITKYLLRHTRFIPRDIIILGNAISKIIFNCKENKNINLAEEIRRCTSEQAHIFGQEILRICAAHLVVDNMPSTAGAQEFTEAYTSVKEYEDSFLQILKEIIFSFKSESMSWDDLQNALEKYIQKEKSLINFFDVLWQNGGIGYINRNTEGNYEEIFVIDVGYREFLLPKNKKNYVFRSCIYDFVGRPSGFQYNKEPVIGGRL